MGSSIAQKVSLLRHSHVVYYSSVHDTNQLKPYTVLQDELETAMRLCGVTDVNEVRGDMSFLNTSELEVLLPPKHDKYPPLQSGWSRIWSKL